MTAKVVATASAVNASTAGLADYDCQRWHAVAVTTIGDRIEEAREARGWSQRELARQSGMAEAAVGVIVTRFKKNPNADIELGTLKAIAAAAGVNLLWMIEGVGPRDVAPDGYQVVYDDRYPNRETALRPLEKDLRPRTPPRVRSAVFNSYRDLTVLEWTRWILAEDERVRFEEEHPAEVAAKLVTAETAKGAETQGPPPKKDPSGRAKPKK